jgi:SWI/SNF-related matrix-associated actin-dependent regulator of chromatin subfamily A-like protein 1
MGQAILELRANASGEPYRLTLSCSQTDRKKAVQPLGVSLLKGGQYSYPPDEIVVLSLKHEFGEELQMTETCQRWFDSKQAKAKEIVERAELEDVKVSLPYADKLKPYQRVAINWAQLAKDCIIADDRGLGKTLEAISVVENENLRKVLIVAPGYLKFGWEREINAWTDSKCVIATGDRRTREGIIEDFARDASIRYLVVNYEMLRTETRSGGYPRLQELRFDGVIFDEAHRLKGRDSQWTKGAKKLHSDRKVLLTGNPIANRPDEIWQLLNILDPRKFTGYWNFVEYYCNIVDSFFGKEIAGVNKARLAQLQFTLQPYLLRRLKADVAPWLPEKIHRYIEVDLEGKQRTFYRRAEKEMVLELEDGGIDVIDTVVAQNLRLQQALANPAILGGADLSAVEGAILELIEDIFASDDKVMVGLWFTKAVHLLGEKLAKRKIKFYTITGEVKAEKRDKIVESFKNDKEKCVLIGGIRAMSEGINMDECDHIIFADKSWTPLDNEQFMDRIHRMTSTRTKSYYHIIVRDSISADREAVLQEKTEMIDEVLSMQAVARKMVERLRK